MLIPILPQDAERAQKFFSCYDLQRSVGKKHESIGSTEQPRECRFCGGIEGETLDGEEVKFKSDAHLIPELLGNKKVFCTDECDACNNHHSLYETALGDYTLPIRALLGLKGKRGFPTYKDNPRNENLRVQNKADDGLFIEVQENSDLVEFEESNKKLTVKANRPTFKPLDVFKALAKVAYSLLDWSELGDYKMYSDLLRTDEFDDRVQSNSFFRLFGYWFPGSPGVVHPIATLYTRKGKKNPPSHVSKILVLQFANQLWQIPLVSVEDNANLGDAQMKAVSEGKPPPSISMPQYPAPFDALQVQAFGAYGTYTDDLSNQEKRRNDHFSVTFSYDNAQQVDTSTTTEENK